MNKKWFVVIFFLIAFSIFVFADDLEVLVANPQGTLDNIEQLDSIQILFSQKMVDTLKESGKDNSLPDFISIDPTLESVIYWSNDRLLRIEPTSRDKIKKQTEFKITVKKGAKSLEGGVLKNDYTFSFSTPFQKIVRVEGYRKNQNARSPYVIALFFNYEIDREEIAKCLKLSFVPRRYSYPSPYYFLPELEKIVNEREADAEEKYYKKVNTLVNRKEEETYFHILDLQNEDVKKFLERSDLNYYIRRYSANNLLLVETDDIAPVESLIKIKFAQEGGCLQMKTKEFAVYLNDCDRAFFLNKVGEYYSSEVRSSFYASEDVVLSFSKSVSEEEFFKNLKIFDLTENKEAVINKPPDLSSHSTHHYLKRIGFKPEVGHKYLVRLDENLKAVDGEILGYPAYTMFTITASPAYVSFGEGEGVWEKARGTNVPFYAKNVKKVKQRIVSLKKEDVIPTLKKGLDYYGDEGEDTQEDETKSQKWEIREIKGLKPEKVFNAGLELKPYLNDSKTGIVLAQIELDEPIDGAPIYNDYYWRAKKSIIQVTDLALTLKYGPSDFLVFVTSLSKAEPVSGCEIEVRDFQNRVLYAGVTDSNGILKVDQKPFSSVDDYSSYYTQEFVVFAKKGDDIAYIVNNWSEGLEPWNFGIPYNWNIVETPQIAGIVFSDRGVYKLSEEVHFKAILRKKEKGEMVLFPKGTKANVKLYDAKGKVKESKDFELSSLGGIDGVFSIEKDYPLGYYRLEVEVAESKISGGFLVAAYRKPEFRVNVDLEQKEKKIEAKVSSSYLFGAPLSEGKVKFYYEEDKCYSLPDNLRKKHKISEWDFFETDYERGASENYLVRKEDEGTLDKNGELKLEFDYKKTSFPKSIEFEAQVEDITEQAITNRAQMTIYPDYYVGIYTNGWDFSNYKDGAKTKIMVVDKDGNLVKGKKVKVELKKIVYKSAQHSTGYNYYDWESRREFESVSKKEITSEENPVDVSFEVPSGGSYVLTANFEEEGLNYSSSSYYWFYGEGYTPWERYTSNKIDLKVEKDSYKVGETAKIMVMSPWEKAKMLITKERATIKDYQVKELSSTQEIIEVPITESDVPNIYVSVVLIKGRGSEEEQDKPQIRIGYAKISVGKEQRKLKISVESDKEEYKPAEKCKVKVNVKDYFDKNVSGAEVTLWAVDVGVLNLTNYKTPDLMERFYREESLSIFNADSREKLISARVTTPKGDEEGGGGGEELGSVDQIRKDFRVLAFWVGSALTDSEGNFEGEFLLPESLSAFRIMAVAHTKDNLFGSIEKEFRISKSLMVNPYFPRFLVVEDYAFARVLLNSRIDAAGKCKVKMESLTPDILSVQNGEAEGDVPSKGKKEFKFKIKALKTGKAKIRVSSEGLGERDAFEVEMPVIMPQNSNINVSCGNFVDREKVEGQIPPEIYPEMGEMQIEVSNNVLTQFTESYEFVVNYPYGCAEQRSSALTTLLNNYKFAKSVGKTEGKAKEAKIVLRRGIKSLEPFQNNDGGFGIWVQDEYSIPYLSAYIGKLLVDAKKEGLLDNEEILNETIKYLKNIGQSLTLRGKEAVDESEGLALAAKVLAEYGEKPDAILTRLSSNLGNLETITLCHLWDAAVASNKKDLSKKIETVIRGRISYIGQEAYLKERYQDERYYYYWYSEDITTAVGLNSFIKNTKDFDTITKFTLHLTDRERKINRYQYNTHRNAYVYEALASYANSFESNKKGTLVLCRLNGTKVFSAILNEHNSWEAKKIIPMSELQKYAKEGFKIEFESDGDSKINYFVKLKWYSSKILQDKEEKGFKIERKYFDLVTKEEKKTFKPGDLIEVRLEVTPLEEVANVAVVDPLPAGFEVLDSAFATTARKLNDVSEENERYTDDDSDYYYWYYYGRFNHIEKHDDKVLLFANHLYKRPIKFSYVVRATTEGEFRLQGASVFCMYNEEMRGASAGSVIKIEKE